MAPRIKKAKILPRQLEDGAPPGTIKIEEKKRRFLNNSIHVLKDLIFSISKNATSHSLANYVTAGAALPLSVSSVVKDGIDAIANSIKNNSNSDSLSNRAFNLIYNASVNSLCVFLDQHRPALSLYSGDLESAANRIEIKVQDFIIRYDHLKNPSSLLEETKILSWLEEFLSTSCSMPKDLTPYFRSLYVSSFTRALWDEYSNNTTYYDPVFRILEGHFSPAAAWERAFIQHEARYRLFVSDNILESGFALTDVYIPMRGGVWIPPVEENKGDDEGLFKIVNSTDYVEEWVVTLRKKTNCILFVSGGPGTGKSSLASVLAHNLSFSNNVLPIYIKLLDFRYEEREIDNAIQRYLEFRCPYFPTMPWKAAAKASIGSRRLLFIFDGLDELTKALGNSGESQGKALVLGIRHFLDDLNSESDSYDPRAAALILGRTASIQESQSERQYSRLPQELILLSMEKNPNLEALRSGKKPPIEDNKNLLLEEQRELWWEKYSAATGENKKYPKELSSRKLSALTCEPLTLFLIVKAKLYENAAMQENTFTRGQIYFSIIKGLFERDATRGAHAGSKLTFEEFFIGLQCIGLSAWYNTDRSTTRNQILEAIQDNLPRQAEIYSRFSNSSDEGAAKLLLAAHVRIRDRERDSDKIAYEFSHKTFGEFLAASCLWTIIHDFSVSLESKSQSVKDVSYKLANFLSRSPASRDFVEFIDETFYSIFHSYRKKTLQARISIMVDDKSDDEKREFCSKSTFNLFEPVIQFVESHGINYYNVIKLVSFDNFQKNFSIFFHNIITLYKSMGSFVYNNLNTSLILGLPKGFYSTYRLRRPYYPTFDTLSFFHISNEWSSVIHAQAVLGCHIQCYDMYASDSEFSDSRIDIAGGKFYFGGCIFKNCHLEFDLSSTQDLSKEGFEKALFESLWENFATLGIEYNSLIMNCQFYKCSIIVKSSGLIYSIGNFSSDDTSVKTPVNVTMVMKSKDDGLYKKFITNSDSSFRYFEVDLQRFSQQLERKLASFPLQINEDR